MKIHEYQAKAILAQYNVPVPRGEVAFTAEEAEAAAKKIGGSVVVKAQIHAGGRGKGGGVKVAKDAAEAARARRQDPRHDAGHAPDRAGRPHRAAAADRRDAAHRARTVPRHRARPRAGQAGVHGVGRGRHGDRRGRRQDAGADPEGDDRAGPGLSAFQARKLAFGIGIPAGQRERRGGGHDGAGQGLRRDGRLARRDQPVHPHQGRQGLRARRQDQLRRQRALPPQGSARTARPERRGSARSGSLAATA